VVLQKAIAVREKSKVAETEYQANIQKANTIQDKHFKEDMPIIMEGLQRLAEQRYSVVQGIAVSYVGVQEHLNALTVTIQQDMLRKSAEALNPEKDLQEFVRAHKTDRIFPPSPVEFEPLHTVKSTTDIRVMLPGYFADDEMEMLGSGGGTSNRLSDFDD